jgi:hypothetical protein
MGSGLCPLQVLMFGAQQNSGWTWETPVGTLTPGSSPFVHTKQGYKQNRGAMTDIVQFRKTLGLGPGHLTFWGGG